MLRRYFRHPIKWDYSLVVIILVIAFYVVRRFDINISPSDRLVSTVSDLATTSLTLAGFVLTLLTVIISFKSSSKVTIENAGENDSTIDLFLASSLYFTTVMHLKNAIKSLTATALMGYFLKLVLPAEKIDFLYYYCIAAIIILLLTLYRCVFILSKIVKMQERRTASGDDSEDSD